MKKNYLLPFLLMMGYGISAQVGINTANPQATLDVAKGTDQTKPDGIIPPRLTGDELRAKSSVYGLPQDGTIVYITAPVTTQTDPKTQDVGTIGFFIYDAKYVHPGGIVGVWNKVDTQETGFNSSVYSAKYTGNFTLLGLSILNPGQKYIPFTTNTSSAVQVKIPSLQMNAGEYTVPQTGVYQIHYNYKEGSGAKASLLSNAAVNITRIPAGTSTNTILDSQDFGGVDLVLAKLSITQSQISSIYSFTAGDKIKFGFTRGLLDIDLLSTVTAEISIYKIR
jgi:hypothetical protein